MSAPSGWQGPVRAAVAVLVLGLLVVWLVKPIGNPCPDLPMLPQGSTASSSPSFSPPGSRTCTYTVAGGTEAKVKHVPWLDWIVLLLLAAAAGGAARFFSPAGRQAREGRGGRPPASAREPRGEREPRPARQPKPPKPPKPARGPRSPAAREPSRTTERDAADRERAREERAARDRARRGR